MGMRGILAVVGGADEALIYLAGQGINLQDSGVCHLELLEKPDQLTCWPV